MENEVIDIACEESDSQEKVENNFLAYLIQSFWHRENLRKILKSANKHGYELVPGQSNEFTISTIFVNSHNLILYPDNSVINQIYTPSQQIEFMSKTLKRAKELGYASLISNPILYSD